MNARRTKFYLDKRNAKIMGVCAGIADYTGVDITIVRVVTVLLTIFAAGPVALLAYFIVGWIADSKPRELEMADPEEKKFWQGVRAAPGRSIRDVRSSFRDIDRRLADIEVHVTNQNRQLSDEIEKLR